MLCGIAAAAAVLVPSCLLSLAYSSPLLSLNRLGQLELATEVRSYEQAIGSAERGEESSRLISCFGLTEGEADLVTLLHGDPSRRADTAHLT